MENKIVRIGQIWEDLKYPLIFEVKTQYNIDIIYYNPERYRFLFENKKEQY